MDRWRGAWCGTAQGADPGESIGALGAGVRRQARQLEDIRRHALSAGLLSWESPAGRNFRSYVAERCAELQQTIELLDAAAGRLDGYGRLIREVEHLGRQAGP
jgi:hypothetical protein